MSRKLLSAVAVLVIVGGFLLWRQDRPAPRPDPQAGGPGGTIVQESAGPIPVVIARAVRRDMPVYLDGIGTVAAYNTVSVTARVDGQLQRLTFAEGQDVKAGDTLAVIDPGPYRAVLAQDIAGLRKDQALLLNAGLDLQRDGALVKKGYASGQSVDTQKALVQQYTAQVAADQALVDYARIELAYCTIVSPIDGRVGIRQVDPGNIVHAADTTPIVVVTQIHPIAIVFTLPADDLARIARGQAAGALRVFALAKDNASVLGEGRLAVYDNQIDQTTDTIKLKAIFQNPDSALWPGQFANVRLLVETLRDALVVPSAVVQVGPNGDYVWTVRPDDTVAIAPVSVGETEGGFTRIVSGLAAGARVVAEGQYRLQIGSPVVPGAGPA